MTFDFYRISFGVTSACFKRTMDDIDNKERLPGVFAYVDNIVIRGCESELQDQNLRQLLRASMEYGLEFNEDKIISVKNNGDFRI